jgi:hypothetical protein
MVHLSKFIYQIYLFVINEDATISGIMETTGQSKQTEEITIRCLRDGR